MKKWLSWIKKNRLPVSGIIGLVIYYLDLIFNVCNELSMPTGWRFGLITVIFVVVMQSIRGKGIDSIRVNVEINPKEENNNDEQDTEKDKDYEDSS